MGKKVTIYEPRLWTKQLHESDKRWNVVVAHRRCGKTVASINHLLRSALTVPKSKYAYIAPTYKQAKNIAWDILKEYASKVDGYKFNESELRADFANGSRITLYGADNPDSLRGLALWGVVFDEYSQQPGNIFTEVIMPALKDHNGYGIWIGTPKGKNDFYRLYEHAKKDDEWNAILLTVEDTGIFKEEDLLDERRLMTQDEFNQEWMCSFEAHIKGAVYADELKYMREEGRICPVHYEPMLPVYTAWDLGMDDATSIGFFQVAGNEIRMIDYLEDRGKGLDYYVGKLHQKRYSYATHYLPHDIQVRELGTGRSRLETIKSLGLTNIKVVKNLSILDGINSTKLLLNKLYIHEGLEYFIDALSQYRREWDDRLGKFKDKPVHDWTSHPADMLRYYSIMYKDRIQQANSVVYHNNDYNWGDYKNEISTY